MISWWRDAVIYQIYPRSFFDDNNDGIGDLKGIASKLDHIRSLGVDGVWVSPFFRSPMKDYGYDIQDYCAVDPIFGTLDDFDQMLARAHEMGLRVIIDLALSHTSDQHAWFRESRADRTNDKADWYVWAEAGPDNAPPNNWLAVFGGSAWEWCETRQQFYLHNFLKEQPDLNVHNEAVQRALLDVCTFWLERGVDGFRLDVVNFLTHDRQLRDNPVAAKPAAPNPYFDQEHTFSVSQPETLDFLKRLRQLAQSYGDIFLVGEIFDDDNIGRTAEYTEPNGPLHSAYSFALLENPIDAAVVKSSLEEFGTRHPKGQPSWSFENHDVVRIVSRWLDLPTSPQMAKALLTLWAGLPGTLFLYQGQELGLPQAELKPEDIQDPYGKNFAHAGRDGCRTPIPWTSGALNAGFTTGQPWLPIPTAHGPLAVEAQSHDANSVLEFARGLVSLRQSTPGLKEGRLESIELDGGLIRLRKGTKTASVEVIVNASDTNHPCSLDADAEPLMVENHGALQASSSSDLELGPFGFAILSRRNS